ncbi:hypothetical protein V1514DRAFT_327433, partial [Lipomyces japonicus]|uniref:mitochondrial 54S ribosomal protein uL24m n=1 Tax=Lipomyces japonicus TaxID=56871 RepID=UPI0034CE0D3B
MQALRRLPSKLSVAGQLARHTERSRNVPASESLKGSRAKKNTPKFVLQSVVEGREVDEFLFATGDIVEVKEGPFAGHISKVSQIVADQNAVALEGVGSLVKQIIPKSRWPEGQNSYVVEYNKPFHHDQVRLIVSLPDNDGVERKTAVTDIRLGEKYYDDRFKKWIKRRYIGSSDIAIPWPDPENPVTDGHYATDYDVARERTFYVTSLDMPPVPEKALDSLINKYSKYRKPELTDEEVLRLTPPEMPLSPARQAYYRETKKIKETKQRKINNGTQDRILEKTAAIIAEKLKAHEATKL